MNAIFNINRFLNVEKRNLFLSYKHLMYIVLGLVSAHILSLLLYINSDESLYFLIHGAIVFFIVTAPCLIEKNSSKINGVFDFILPGSTFEKFFSIWIKYIVFIPGLIYLTLFILHLIGGLIPIAEVQEHARGMTPIKSFSLANIYSMLGFQSVFIAGYFYFRRYAFAKTALILLIAFVVFMFISIIVGVLFFSGQDIVYDMDMQGNSESFHMGYKLGSSVNGTGLADNIIIKTCDTIIGIVFPIGLWIVSYFKLRETEI